MSRLFPDENEHRANIESEGDALSALIASLTAGDYSARLQITAVLKETERASVPMWIRDLKDAEASQRQSAAYVLGKIGDATVVPSLITALRDADEDVRQYAAASLVEIKDPAALPTLIAALRDPNVFVRNTVAKALGEIGDPTATPALIAALQDEEENEGAVEALGKIGEAAVPDLIKAFRETAPNARWKFGNALIKCGVAAIPGLVKLLQEPNEGTRIRAAEALGWIGDSEAIPALSKALQEDSIQVRVAAAKALREIGDSRSIAALGVALSNETVIPSSVTKIASDRTPFGSVTTLTAICSTENLYFFAHVVHALAAIGIAAGTALLETFHQTTVHRRRIVAKALQRIAEGSCEYYLDRLRPPDREMQRKIAAALEEVQDVRTTPELIQALQAPSGDDRIAILRILGQRKDPAALPALVEILQEDEAACWDALYEAAVAALAEIGDRAATAALVAVLKDPNKLPFFQYETDNIRQSLTEALRKLGDVTVVPGLIADLRDPDVEVRRNAAVAIRGFRDVRVVPALIEALQDKDALVRFRIVGALETAGDIAALHPLIAALQDPGIVVLPDSEKFEISDRVSDVLGALREEAVPALIEVLEGDRDQRVQIGAAKALGMIGDARAVDALIATSLRTDKELSETAAKALRGIADVRTIPFLLDGLVDTYWDVRLDVVVVMEEIGLEALPALGQALRSANPFIRWRVAEILETILHDSPVSASIRALQRADWMSYYSPIVVKKMENATTIPALIQILQDTESRVREVAAETLGKIGDATAVPALIAALQDPIYYVRRSAAKALGKIGEASAIPALTAALEDVDKEVRDWAVFALKEIGTAAAVPGLILALKDPDYFVCRSAVWALEKVRDRAAIGFLEEALHDTDCHVRQRAARTLAQLPNASASPRATTLPAARAVGIKDE